MKLALARSTPSSFSAAIIETGSVVALEEVSSAVTSGCKIFLMKVKGDVPRTALSMLPYTFGVLLLGPGFALLHKHQLLSAGPMLCIHRD